MNSINDCVFLDENCRTLVEVMRAPVAVLLCVNSRTPALHQYTAYKRILAIGLSALSARVNCEGMIINENTQGMREEEADEEQFV